MERKQNTRIGVEKADQGDTLLDGDTQQGVKQAAREVQDRAQQAAGRAGDAADDAKRTAQRLADDADQATQGLQDKLGQQAREVGHQVERTAINQMERGRHQVAQGVHAAAEALRLGAQQVRQREGIAAPQFVERLAEPVDRISDYLERHDTREIAHDLESFARRNEGLFLGGAFALGMLGARFLKSSSTEMQRAHDEGMGLRAQTARVREPEHDAVGRPNAPGYEAPWDRATSADDPEAAGPRNR